MPAPQEEVEPGPWLRGLSTGKGPLRRMLRPGGKIFQTGGRIILVFSRDPQRAEGKRGSKGCWEKRK